MKKFTALIILSALFLTACVGTSLTVIDDETLATYPELEDIAVAWEALADAAEAEDCEAFLAQMRSSLQLTEEDCPSAFEYYEDGVPPIEWEKTQWNADMGKAKIYEVNSGSITSFILNGATDVWGADTIFWD